MSFIQTMTGGSVRHLNPVKRAKATGLVAEIYAALDREFALVPPLTIHSVCPDVLAGAWVAMREAFIVDPDHRAVREAVASSSRAHLRVRNASISARPRGNSARLRH
jgi:hypothetical protein